MNARKVGKATRYTHGPKRIMTFSGDSERYPVIDAKTPMLVAPLPEDYRVAMQRQGDKCVFAQFCKRAFGARHALFHHHVCYIVHPDAKGKFKAHRYWMSEEGKEAIEQFDKTGEWVPNVAFRLLPPSPGRQLETARRNQKRYRGRKGTGKHIRSGKHPDDRKVRTRDARVRSGSGRTRFTFEW